MVMIIVEANQAEEGSGAFAGGCNAMVYRIVRPPPKRDA